MIEEPVKPKKKDQIKIDEEATQRLQAEYDEEERLANEVAIDAILLAIKSPRIVDWKIHKEGKKSYNHILRVDGKSQMYMDLGRIVGIKTLLDVVGITGAQVFVNTALMKLLEVIVAKELLLLKKIFKVVSTASTKVATGSVSYYR
nr:hypothetical protein [Tanacetum cinerariifolium]